MRETKFWGLLVYESVSWDIQMKALKVYKNSYVLRTMSKLYSVDNLNTIYFAYTLTQIIWYCFTNVVKNDENLDSSLY